MPLPQLHSGGCQPSAAHNMCRNSWWTCRWKAWSLYTPLAPLPRSHLAPSPGPRPRPATVGCLASLSPALGSWLRIKVAKLNSIHTATWLYFPKLLLLLFGGKNFRKVVRCYYMIVKQSLSDDDSRSVSNICPMEMCSMVRRSEAYIQ